MQYRRVPPNPEARCTCGWCGCRAPALPPAREYRPLPLLLKLEGRHQEADELQDRWEKYGSYEIP